MNTVHSTAHDMKKAVFFDLDGTLLDTRPGIFRCVRAMLTDMKMGTRTDEEIMAIIGPPLTLGFARILSTDDDELINKAVAAYRVHYAEGGMYEAVIYPGIVELLADLSLKGIRLCVVTSKAEVLARKIVERFNLDRFFISVYGPDLEGRRSDKTELIAHALRNESLLPDDVIMVGDREHDIIGARGNGVLAAGALWGFGSEAELIGAGADFTAGQPLAVLQRV
jgi:phosphoglycolate phosphatase